MRYTSIRAHSFRLGFGGGGGGVFVGFCLGEGRDILDRAFGEFGTTLGDVVVVPLEVYQITWLKGEDGSTDRLGHFHIPHVILYQDHEFLLLRVAVFARLGVFEVFDDGEAGELAGLSAALGAEGRAAHALVILQALEAGDGVMGG